MFDHRPAMRVSQRPREWVHGLTALILGLFLLGGGTNLGISKAVVDLWGGMLAIPEHPAVLLRSVFLEWQSRSQDRRALEEELVRLRNENARLRVLDAGLANEKILSDLSTRMHEARVTLRAPMSWWNEVRIDRGERDHVKEGMPVFCQGYLVGRVSSVSLMSSWAELLTSPSMMIPVVVQETRELGVVVGDGEGAVLLKYIPAGRGERTGMKLDTALIGEQVPPGYPIGKIAEELEMTPDGYVTYRVALGADLSRFYSVSLGPLGETQ
ncbi:MAG: rod shape-determining protein MreC [Fretibacterium sp.]|nr:rod shape-determining protein MreC [Fretibacterium sp.]